jgi:hypothetical protein
MYFNFNMRLECLPSISHAIILFNLALRRRRPSMFYNSVWISSSFLRRRHPVRSFTASCLVKGRRRPSWKIGVRRRRRRRRRTIDIKREIRERGNIANFLHAKLQRFSPAGHYYQILHYYHVSGRKFPNNRKGLL